MDPLLRKHTSSTSAREVDHLRSRVNLYLTVMLAIDVVAYISDFLSPMFIDDLVMPTYPLEAIVLRRTVTVLVIVAWMITRFRRPNHATLVGLETTVTVGLALLYVYMAPVHMRDEVAGYGTVFAMFGFMLLLSVRAALVPSPVWRTAAIGIVSVVSLFVVGREAVRPLAPTVLDGLAFSGGAVVLATSVTSGVIYGLRRKVREALQMGQYTLEEKLGEGGMGTVYRARHARLRRQAAIKLIKTEGVGGGAIRPETLQRFEREALVTANLQSPHTVQLYDFGVSEEGEFHYVMELLDGIDLETAVTKHGPMPAGRAVFLLRQVCESLEEAHAAGLVHRDIKPANIFLCRLGLRYDFVKVLDFGLVGLGAEPEQAGPRLTAEGFVGGTPSYLAPEMATGKGPVDGRADIYAMGCVAHWLLTAHPPFERDTPMATVLAHVNDAPSPPSSQSELPIPAALDALVLECLAKDPADRPASVAAFSKRLAQADDPGGWDQAQAESWWKLHSPAQQVRRAELEPADASKATRVLYPR